VGLRIIENYKPPDDGWGIVIGRLRPKPEPKPDEGKQKPVEPPPDEAA
jgi:hypothetical protein